MRWIVGGLVVAGFVLLGLAVWQFGVASNFVSLSKLPDAEFALTIGFTFVMGGITCLLTALSEYRAENRHEEVMSRFPPANP